MDAKEDEMIFPDQDSTSFPASVKNNLAKIAKTYSKKEFLRYHQYIIYNYVIKNAKSRGLLLAHEMGMGKSISAVALAEFYRTHDPTRKIVVLLSKSLQDNFRENIVKFIRDQIKKAAKDTESQMSEQDIERIVKEKYKFVSLNASNMFTQMTRIGKTSEELIAEKQFKEFAEVIDDKKDFLENSLLIIDEFHNLSNAITNGSSNAIRLYDAIMKTKNIKLLFLTGTPIINSPFELVPTFNMLRGLVKIDSQNTTTLFPELQKDFDMHFIDHKNNRMKNVARYQNRIFGLCSYYGSLYFGSKKGPEYPSESPIKVVRVPMSSEQFVRYDQFRDLEIEEAAIKGRPMRSERFAAKGDSSSSYRVKSRQVSNFLIPEHALGPPRGSKARVKYINKISPSELKRLDIFSPKFQQILDNATSHVNKGEKGLFYSEFVSGEGLAIFSKVLDAHGYSCWQKNVKFQEEADSFGLDLSNKSTTGGKSKEAKSKEAKSKEVKSNQKQSKKQTYAIISGDVSFEDREKIIAIYNSKDNMYGEKISMLLVSKTGAEGLDLKGVRHIHICEPYWNYARIVQIIARGVRYKSHADYPKSEQTVQPYIYLSDYPKTYNMKKKKEETTDVDLFQTAQRVKVLIDNCMVNTVAASIDCTAHEAQFDAAAKKQIKCKLCSPNDKKLYHPILSKDMLLTDPCDELKQATVQAKEIDINGEKYYYSMAASDTPKDKTANKSINNKSINNKSINNKSINKKFDIFRFDKSLSGYVPLQPHELNYAVIMRKLLKL
jgi:superfamily II DNA or RNA helicase